MSEKNGAKLSKGRKIYRIVSSAVTTVVAVFLCFIAVFVIIQRCSNKSPHIFGYYMFSVLTESMEPLLYPGDVILSKQAVASELQVGDVVTYKAESGVLAGYNLTHRIVRFITSGDNVYVVTQGDNASGEDAPILAEKIEAVMQKKLDGISGMLNFLKTPQGFVVLIVLPLLAVLVFVIISYFRDKFKLEKKQAAIDSKSDSTEKSADALSEEEITKMIEDLKRDKKDEEK